MMRDEFLTSERPDADADTGMPHQPALDPAVTLAEYAESSADAPEPVLRTLRALSERSFTGEVELGLGTGVLVYLDGGRPYYAERVGDAPLGERLVSLGVLRDEQLRQGLVQVGDVEHLGRLFEREPSIDRDAVLAATELITDDILSEIAPHDAAVRFTSYRHHRSGVHRWFVGPGRTSPLRPVDEVRQVDRTVFDQLPDISAAPGSLRRPIAGSQESPNAPVEQPEVHIEWDQPNLPVAERRPLDLPAIDEAEIDAELRSFDADVADWSGPVEPADLHTPAQELPTDPSPAAPAGSAPDGAPEQRAESDDPVEPDLPAASPADVASSGDAEPEPAADDFDDFTIVWPDGSSEATVTADVPPAGPDIVALDDGQDAGDSATASIEDQATAPAAAHDESAAASSGDGDDGDDGRIRLGVPTPAPVDPFPAPDAGATVPPADAAEPSAVDADEASADPGESADVETPSMAEPGSDEPGDPAVGSSPSRPEPQPAAPIDLSLPPLRLEQLPPADAEVPDEVAEAVRRALAAIERVAAEPDATTRLRVGSVELPDVEMPKLLDPSVVDTERPAPSAPADAPRPAATVAAPAPAAAFAPPTADMRAEAIFARAEPMAAPGTAPLPAPGQPSAESAANTAAENADVENTAVANTAAQGTPAENADVENTAAEDTVAQGTSGEDGRKGALRRLIGSLRRK